MWWNEGLAISSQLSAISFNAESRRLTADSFLANMDFTEQQIQRYSRHIILQDVGGKGQLRLAKAKVLLIGAGGLGSPASLYLAAAGIGTIGLVDGDVVDLSNLQRQILHSTATVGHPKVESGKKTLAAINPDITINAHHMNVDADNILGLISDYDMVLDGSDNFTTRFLVNDACFFAKKTLISASMFRFEGQLTTIKPHAGYPCYRCLYPEPPPAGLVPNCQEAGVLGVLAGTMGILQASEAIKEILGIGETLADRLLIYDALEMKFRKVGRPKDPACRLCGPKPSITDLSSDYTVTCTI
jgi:adenylyltransferase/sulfurtransferase